MKNLKFRLQKPRVFHVVLITLVISVVIGFFYIFLRKPTYITVEIKVGSESVFFDGGTTKAWLGQLIHEGMTEKDGLGKTTAEVVKIRSYDTANTKAVYATTRILAVYNRNSNQYTFRGKPLLIGSTIRLYLDRVLIDGLITYIEGVKDPRIKKRLVVEAQLINETNVFPEISGVKQHIADAITEGQEIKDSQNNTIIKVVKKREEDAKKNVTTSDGRIFIQTYPQRKDVYLTLEVQAMLIGDRYYVFDDIPLIIGWGIPINTKTFVASPDITSIKPLD